jgi:hypothetical protein
MVQWFLNTRYFWSAWVRATLVFNYRSFTDHEWNGQFVCALTAKWSTVNLRPRRLTSSDRGVRCSGEGAKANTRNILPYILRLFKHQSFITTQVASPHWIVQIKQHVYISLIMEPLLTDNHTRTWVDTQLSSFCNTRIVYLFIWVNYSRVVPRYSF